MKQAYLIYYPEEMAKNRGMIQLFQKWGIPNGIYFHPISLKSTFPDDSDVRSGVGADLERLDIPDLVINRTRNPRISKWYQRRGIPVFHPEDFVALANHKYNTLQYFERNLPEQVAGQRWCPGTIRILPDRAHTKGNKNFIGHGFVSEEELWHSGVIKSVDGHGGSEVFLAEDSDRWKRTLAGRELILQERIDSDSKDIRIYVLGNEIYHAMLRMGTQDFRSNYSLGGSVREWCLTAEEREFVFSFIETLPEEWQGMYGIDFIVDREGRLIFNELEEMVGCRMLYQYTDRDIVRDYVSWMRGFL